MKPIIFAINSHQWKVFCKQKGFSFLLIKKSSFGSLLALHFRCLLLFVSELELACAESQLLALMQSMFVSHGSKFQTPESKCELKSVLGLCTINHTCRIFLTERKQSCWHGVYSTWRKKRETNIETSMQCKWHFVQLPLTVELV